MPFRTAITDKGWIWLNLALFKAQSGSTAVELGEERTSLCS